MSSIRNSSRWAVLGGLALILGLIPASAVRAQGWGTVKGQVIWGGKDVPAPEKLTVDKDPKECLRNGPLLSDEYVVDPKTKGVRWVVVWLIDASGDFNKDIPVNPALKAPAKKVMIDQPCCKFEPHIVCLLEGDTLVAKNSGGVSHNTKIDSFGDNPNVNPLLPPGASKDIAPWTASSSPSTVACGIHSWMKGYIRTFKNPYFAVTNETGEFEIKDAPEGTFNIVVWHESGYLTKGLKKGDPITIKAGDVTEVKYELKPKDKD
jgi:hypothetical protein